MKQLFCRSLHVSLLMGGLAWITSAQTAWANGRPPGTTGLVVSPGAGQKTHLLGLTFGLGVSHNGGQSFHWVCEEAIGGPTGVDALMAAPSDQVLITGSSYGLYISRDGGCDWQPQPLFAPPSQVSAIAIHPKDANHWYVAVNVPDENRGLLYETNDGGHLWKKLSVGDAGIYLYSIAVGPGGPHEADTWLAVAASNNGGQDSCLLFTSKNGGASWKRLVARGAPPASATPQVALHPHDSNALMLTALDITTNGSIVLQSHDFGGTFGPPARIDEPVRNIVFEGPTKEGSTLIATTGHLWRVREGGDAKVLPRPKSNACATWHDGTLYVCGSDADHQDGFALAKSRDGGETLSSMLALADLAGSNCKQTTSTSKMCSALWPNQRAAIIAAAHADPGAEFIASEQAPSAAATTGSTAPQNDHTTRKAIAQQGCRCGLGGAEGAALVALWAPMLAYRIRQRRQAKD